MSAEQNHQQLKERWAHLGEPELSGFVSDFKLKYHVFIGVFVVLFSIVFMVGGFLNSDDLAGKIVLPIGGAFFLAVGIYVLILTFRNLRNGWGIVVYESRFIVSQSGVDKAYGINEIEEVRWIPQEFGVGYSLKTKKRKSVYIPPIANAKEVADAIDAKLE